MLILTDGVSRVSQVVIDEVKEFKQRTGSRLIGALFEAKWERSMGELLDATLVVDNAQSLDWTEDVLRYLV